MTYQSHSGQRYSPPHKRSASNVASVPERQVRFTEQFFAPSGRAQRRRNTISHRLSAVDLPAVRDRLATNYDDNTLATDDPDVRVYIGSGVLVNRFAIYTVLEAEVVEAFWLTIDLHRGDN